MITKNSSYKLKASSKSAARHNHDQPEEANDAESVDGDATGDANHKYFFVPRVPKIRLNKANNFFVSKPAGSRNVERRNANAFRSNGRGGNGLGVRAKGEREFAFDGSGLFPYSKYTIAELEKKCEMKLPEDTRISKLLRRLSIEEDPDNSLQISKKLQDVIILPENATYIRKSFAILRDSMLHIMLVAPGMLAKKQCARAFGRIGYVMAQDLFDFGKYVKVIMKYNAHGGHESTVCLFMEALHETLMLEKKKPIIDKTRMHNLIHELVISIEPTENADVFKLILDNLMTCTEFSPSSFNEFFKDTIDLLFGWHVDHTQPLCNIEFISAQLQRVSGHFQRNLEFSITLVLHFVEDIQTYSSQMAGGDDDPEGESVEHVTVFVLSLNTVLKCLRDNVNVAAHAMFTRKVIVDAMKQVSDTIVGSVTYRVCDNLIVACNECMLLLVGFYMMSKNHELRDSFKALEIADSSPSTSSTDVNVKDTSVHEMLFSLIDQELELISVYSDSSIISLLALVTKVIKELSADLRIELIPKLVGPKSPLIKLRSVPFRELQEATIAVYQALLNLKNIPLLQEVYRYLLEDLQASYKYFMPHVQLIEATSFDPPEAQRIDHARNAEINCLYLLRCLAQLANDSGSIVGMWVLKPSILELLAVFMRPFEDQLGNQAPMLQYSILYLLYSHCKCYNFFISSSTLVTLSNTSEYAAASPNCGNFSLILDVLYKCFMLMNNDNLKLVLLQWSKEILTVGETYMEALYVHKEFTQLIDVLIDSAYAKNYQIALAGASNIERLLTNRQLSWRNEFLAKVNKLCTLHMTSTDAHVRDAYTKLRGCIPWDVVILESNSIPCHEVDNENGIGPYTLSNISLSKRLNVNGTLLGEMPAHNFKLLMNYLLKNEPAKENFIVEMFANCWPLEADNNILLSDQYRDLCLNAQPVLYNWATWEAAQLCVNSKLRTPLGKPNETFTSFENALKQLARDVMKAKQENAKTPISITRVRLLLQFIEHLEMAIFNASEGTALAIPPPQKPVRTFFCTNASTCREWLSRIRVILVQLALHAGQSVIAVRHGQQLLWDLHKTGKSETIDFERAVVYVAMALLNLNESEALMGLYVWCKNLNMKYDWVKCAADQANKKYEAAVTGYQMIIDHLANNRLDIYVRHFISDQVLVCFKQLNSWLDVVQYKNNRMNILLAEGENGIRYTFNTVNFECAQSLFNVESGTHVFEELTSWKELDQAHDSWSSYDTLLTTECALYNVSLNLLAEDSTTLTSKISDNMRRIRLVMQENSLFVPAQFNDDFNMLNFVAYGLQNAVNNVPASTCFLVSGDFENDVHKIDCSILSKILWWTEYFNNLQSQHHSTFANNLRLNIIKKSRKEGNSNVATSQLYRFLKNNNLLFTEDGGSTESNLLINIAECFKQKVPEIAMWDVDSAKAAQELIKLLYDAQSDTCQPRKLAFDLCAIASTSISKSADMYGNPGLKQVSSKILLKLGTWLQMNEVSVTELTSPLGKLLMVLPEIGIENIGNNVIPLNEMVIGKLLQFSVNQCQILAKTWHAFGTWCYRWGKKIVDNSADLSNTLTAEDKNAIKCLLPDDCDSVAFNRVLSILSQTRAYVDEEDIDSNEIHTSEMIRTQLKNVSLLCSAPEEMIEKLVDMWRTLQKRVYAYYEHSVEAYFKYLQLATNSENVSKATESNTVTVTLRLLRLIVKHALELQSVLEEGLSTTPTHPWKIIIPQLFSRLNHPESYVRERVSELLCRVAEDAPHLITFPAVVGALEGGVKFDFSEISLPKDCLSQNNEPSGDAELNDMEEDTYDSDNEDSKNVLQACFKSMVETLSKQAPETITQVQTLVKELRRIILLWDELWLGTLAQYHSEINKRQQQLQFEVDKVHNNSYLFPEDKTYLLTEKHRIIIKPIIFILEQLYDITSVEPETPHEKHFQEKYLPTVHSILQKLKNPENPQDHEESWKLLKELQNNFQQKAHKRSMLKMDNISPALANIRDTVISMPGQDNARVNTKVYISHVSNQVSILPTKTKPKKLVFYGTDGRSYTYLFKGLEDLHLDERIMQFLSIANTMMAQNTEGTGHNLYRARHYSVIPLGPRSGLISWVGGTTPAFALYKRWQQREASKSVTKATTNVLRPSELFYNKLNPLLQEHGVKNMDNRKEWPLAALKQVLSELMAETPSNLLAKELWCHAVSPGAWWEMVRKYSYSVAVMSIIGYIIGLGDRHLDNVLVDLNTGEVVHIDYNVCFEKGKTLRVPEKVPFRLTPNIRDALGVTGVEGMFRIACENILKTMKKGRETLLTLLEAFVYDPLVDWTVGNEGLVGTTFGGMSSSASHRQTRKDLEREVTITMYHLRCIEAKSEWKFNLSDITRLIPEIYVTIDTWTKCFNELRRVDDLLQDLHQQMALVKEAEANGLGKHSLRSLPMRYEKYKSTQDSFVQARRDLEKLESECDNHIVRFGEAIKVLQSQQAQQWYAELNAGGEPNGTTKTVHVVKEFLQSVGQSTVLAQCEQLEIDDAATLEQQLILTHKCLNLLQEYWTIISQSPPAFVDGHRIYYYRDWCRALLNTTDLSVCAQIYQQFFALNDVNSKHVNAIFTHSFNLNVIYNNIAAKTTKAYEDLTNARADEPAVLLEQHYAEGKIALANFLARDATAPKALEFVIVSELLVLNRTFLTLETAAAKTGDWLIKLTSREGDWFLDELTLSSSRAIELINYLRIQNNIEEDDNFMGVVNGVISANNLYKSLHELNFNFHTIILPESIKKIQSEEPSVLQMIHELNAVIMSVGPLQELIIQSEKQLTCLVMEMEFTPIDSMPGKLIILKHQYQELLHAAANVLSPGKMLLMGFNGLFDKLHLESNNVVTQLGSLNIPSSWRNLDQVREAKGLAPPIFNQHVHAILDDIFFLKRLQTMCEFFALCREMCESFKGNSDNVVTLDDEQLLKPIRKFIADFISRQFLGITTEAIAYVQCYLLQRLGLDVTTEIEQKDIGAEHKVAMDELYHKGWNTFLKNGLFTQNALAQASSIETNVRNAWEKIQEPKKLEKAVALLQSSLTRIQNQLTAHNWLHEEVLSQQLEKCSFIRSKFIMDLRTKTATLTLLKNKAHENREKQKSLVASILQRLKWAAGANPDINETLTTFEAAVAAREKRQVIEQQICAYALTACTNILHFEILRCSTPESKACDKLFIQSHQQWSAACQFQSVKLEGVSHVEESMMKFYSPEMEADPKWILRVAERISEAIKDTQTETADLKAKLYVAWCEIGRKLDLLRAEYNHHCTIMNDFKTWLKAMTKIDEYSVKAQQFIYEYRHYVEAFSNVFHPMKKEQMLEEVALLRKKLAVLEHTTPNIYNNLMELENKKGKRQLVRQEGVSLSPVRSMPAKQESMTKGQQRNAYAVGVWRRVRMKLEGKDPDPGRKLSTQEQVDYVIREATSLDNLALLYEGWTPWV